MFRRTLVIALAATAGLMAALCCGCHDDNDHQTEYRRERGIAEERPHRTNVDVHVETAPRDGVVLDERPDVVYDEPDAVYAEPEPSETYVEREPRPVYVERERQPRKIEVERRPVVVERSPSVVIVRERPPTVIVERRPPPPRYAHVWISGCWHHDGHKFVWVKGRYERARPGYRYVEPRWSHGDRGWEFHVGVWQRDGHR